MTICRQECWLCKKRSDTFIFHARPFFIYYLPVVQITSLRELPVRQAQGPELVQPQARGPEPVPVPGPPSQQVSALPPSCNQQLQTITSRRKAWKE
jgi:hypothetical protein